MPGNVAVLAERRTIDQILMVISSFTGYHKYLSKSDADEAASLMGPPRNVHLLGGM
jgi:hypothetical protein